MDLPSSDVWLQIEYPYDIRCSNVRINVSGTNQCYFAYSKNGTNWIYLGHPDHDVTDEDLTLVVYTTASGANVNYINLAAGENEFNLPTGSRMRYGRVYISSSVHIADFDWQPIPKFISKDGRFKLR